MAPAVVVAAVVVVLLALRPLAVAVVLPAVHQPHQPHQPHLAHKRLHLLRLQVAVVVPAEAEVAAAVSVQGLAASEILLSR